MVQSYQDNTVAAVDNTGAASATVPPPTTPAAGDQDPAGSDVQLDPAAAGDKPTEAAVADADMVDLMERMIVMLQRGITRLTQP